MFMRLWSGVWCCAWRTRLWGGSHLCDGGGGGHGYNIIQYYTRKAHHQTRSDACASTPLAHSYENSPSESIKFWLVCCAAAECKDVRMVSCTTQHTTPCETERRGQRRERGTGRQVLVAVVF